MGLLICPFPQPTTSLLNRPCYQIRLMNGVRTASSLKEIFNLALLTGRFGNRQRITLVFCPFLRAGNQFDSAKGID